MVFSYHDNYRIMEIAMTIAEENLEEVSLRDANFNWIVNISDEKELETANILFESEVQTISRSKTLEKLAVEAKIFKSVSEARKNGWAGNIPTGFHLIGTKRRRIWVWNPITQEHSLAKQFIFQ
jgi:hypothetical protein